METGAAGKAREELPRKAGNAVKWAFAVGLAAAAVTIGVLAMFRTHPAQATVEKAFAMAQDGEVEGLLACVDPEGQLGRSWQENERGWRDAVLSLLERYRLEFSSLKFSTRAEGEAAEVELKGGRVSIYGRGGEGPPDAFFDLDGVGLIFYLERKGGSWLIEGVNYDVVEMLAGDMELLPF